MAPTDADRRPRGAREALLVRRSRRLGLAQRVVIVIAIGLILGAVGTYVTTLGRGSLTGWFGYAPLASGPLGRITGPDLSGWERLLVWIGLVLVWLGCSLPLLAHHAGSVEASQGSGP